MSNLPLPGIEHVVLLMFENRSFDNVFGGFNAALATLGSSNTVNGLNGTETNPVSADPSNTNTVTVQQLTDPDAGSTVPNPDPNELYSSMTGQIYGFDAFRIAHNPDDSSPNMQGFAIDYDDVVGGSEQNVMTYVNADMMPGSWFVAVMGAVSDTWFASAPCQTFANRVLSICATPGLQSNGDSCVDDTDYFPSLGSLTDVSNAYGFVTDTSIFELFQNQYPNATSPSWKVYYHDTPLSALVSYVNDQYDATNPGQTSSANVVHFDDSDYPLPSGYATFASDVANGTLPMFSIIEPRYHSNWSPANLPPNSNHPGLASSIESNGGINSSGLNNYRAISIQDGEALLFDVLEALITGSSTNPDPLANTLLVVLYDEHGGLYDHVPPPTSVPTPFNTAPSGDFTYNRLGVRVPAFFLGGNIAPQTVFRAPSNATYPWFDHTSLLATLEAQFNLAGPLTPRDGNVPDLSGLITLSDDEGKAHRATLREKFKAVRRPNSGGLPR